MERFDFLLSFPFTWKPSKICKFWNDFHNHIKPKFQNGQRVPEPEISRFCDRIEKEARSCYLFGPIRNWREVMGHNHFNLVTRTENNSQLEWGTSLEMLLRVIRNKHEHQDGFSDADRLELGWFQMTNNKLEFDEKSFASYWISKIPNLMAFLWSQFAFFEASFREYYPDSISNYSNICLEDYVKLMGEACSHQLDEGYLIERFSDPSSSCSIELRTLSGDLLSRLLNGSTMMEVVVSATKVTVTWDGNEREAMEYVPVKGNTLWKSGDICVYIFLSESDKVYINALCGKYCDCDPTCSSSRIALFTSKDAIEGTILKFANNTAFPRNPIAWRDLSESTRNRIEFGDEFYLSLQSRVYLFKDLLPNNDDFRKEILSQLESSELNKLLRNRKLSILNSEIPNVDQFYRERVLFNRTHLDSSIFQEPLEYDVFIVLKNGSEKLPKNPSYKVKVISTKKIFPMLTIESTFSNVVLAADTEVGNLQVEFKNFLGWENPSKNIRNNIHFLRYLGNEIFQWLFTNGSLQNIKSQLTIAARKAGIMTESQFLESLEIRKTDERILFIADQPGMGKSQVLYNLAKTITKRKTSGVNKLVIVTTVSQFVEKLRKNFNRKIDESKILKSVIKTLTDITCSGEFEIALISNLLNGHSNFVQFELMLDGLDEVTPGSRELVVYVLKIIDLHKELPVRIWVTLRDHMLDSIRRCIGSLGYKLDPFSKSEQVNFLVNFWSRNFDSYSAYSEHLDTMREFAEKCIGNFLFSEDAELSGIPLQCRMIGEIYEKQVLNLDFNLEKRENFNLNDLYEKMLERKLEIYLREKKMLPLNISNDDCLVKLTRTSIERYLEYLSIELLFSSEVANTLRTTLTISAEPHIIEILSTMALEHGVLQDLSPLKFIHRTFAEYLVARCVSNFVANSECHCGKLDEIDTKFAELLWNKVLIIRQDYSGSKFEHPSICRFLERFLINVEMTLPTFYEDCVKKLLGDNVTGWAYNAEETPPVDAGVKYAFRFVAAAGHVDTPNPLVNVIRLLAQSRTELLELLMFAMYMEEYDAAESMIEITGFSAHELNQIRELNSDKLGIIHFLLHPSSPYYPDEMLRCNEMKRSLELLAGKHPALLEERDSIGRTPLLYLVNKLLPFCWKEIKPKALGLETVELLTRLGANIHDVDEHMNSMLHLGKPCFGYDGKIFWSAPFQYILVENGYFQIIKFFLKNGCSETEVNRFNSEGFTPFLSLLYIVDQFFATGFNQWMSEYRKWNTVLDKVSEIFKLLQEHGQDLNARDEDGDTVLCKAITSGFSLVLIDKLVEDGAEICQDAIHRAVQMGSTHVMKYLIGKCPSCMYFRNRNGESLSEYQSSRTLKKYLQHKINSEMSEYMGCSFLNL